VELQYRVRRNGLSDAEVATIFEAARRRAEPKDAADFAMEAFVRWQAVALVPGRRGRSFPRRSSKRSPRHGVSGATRSRRRSSL
jgi:hypothetical protein